jgi:predicted transposase YbfD/YdcC
LLHPKKVGTLPVEGCDTEKRTNEIKIAIPMLDSISIKGRTITGDALLTQRKLAKYIVSRDAHYHFTVKLNQPQLHDDIALYFQNQDGKPGFTVTGNGEHGRLETRTITTTTDLNSYVNFPHVSQVFMIDRQSICKKTGITSQEKVYGITSQTTDQASPKKILTDNRGHWSVESCHWMIDWNYDEDRGRIRTGYGPENITRLRRFAIGLLKAKKSKDTIPEMMKKLLWNHRAVFDCLKMTRSSNPRSIT